jgi:hypothetical protein
VGFSNPATESESQKYSTVCNTTYVTYLGGLAPRASVQPEGERFSNPAMENESQKYSTVCNTVPYGMHLGGFAPSDRE